MMWAAQTQAALAQYAFTQAAEATYAFSQAADATREAASHQLRAIISGFPQVALSVFPSLPDPAAVEAQEAADLHEAVQEALSRAPLDSRTRAVMSEFAALEFVPRDESRKTFPCWMRERYPDFILGISPR